MSASRILKSDSLMKLVVAVFCVIGFRINYTGFTPGFMSPDSFEQYAQSISHQYQDWHPPVMAWVWGLLNHICQGPQVMLALQLLFLWAACYNLAIVFRNYIWAALMFFFFLEAPFIQNFSGYIIKDTQMAFGWLLAVSILLRVNMERRNRSVIAATVIMLLLVYGALLRPNALPAALPLIYWWVWTFIKIKKMMYKWGLTLIICSLVLLVQFTLPVLLKAKKEYPENKLYLHDLAGIYARTGKNVFPEILYSNPQFDTAYLRNSYHPATFDDIWWNNDGVTLLPSVSGNVREKLRRAWLTAIVRYPGVYLGNRFEGFLYYLRLKKRTDFYCSYYMSVYPDPNDYGFAPDYENKHYKHYKTSLEQKQNMFYMQPWFWFFLNFILLSGIPFIRNRQIKRSFVILVLSGVFYKLPDLFVYQCDTDFRYFYWNIIVCSLSVFLFIYSLIMAKKGA